MPSIYVGCKIEDDISEALKEVRGTFQDYQKQTDDLLSQLSSDLAQLSGTPISATVTIGSDPTNTIKWTAKVPGTDGNNLTIMYLNIGPIVSYPGPVYVSRPPSAEVNGTAIYVYLAIKGGDPFSDPTVGSVDPAYPVSTCLPIWLSNPDVAAVVDAELVGTGSGSRLSYHLLVGITPHLKTQRT
jgi:hypothetical protein